MIPKHGLLSLTFALLLFVVVVNTSSATRPAFSAMQTGCQQGSLPHGALWLICIPAQWNGDAVFWAHGYVAFNEPLDFYHLQAGTTYLPDAVQQRGYAFAATSYRVNGLAVLQGADDIRELVVKFGEVAGKPANRSFIIGASEGGLVATLLLEQAPHLFNGGLAACGPIGSFKSQVNYFGDFRLLFDYFFPGVLPGSPLNIPPELIENWFSTYVPAVEQALRSDPAKAWQLINTSRAAINLLDFSQSIIDTTVHLLWYNVFGTNDARAKLGGNPFGNQGRWYWGSFNDWQLNASIQRFTADAIALQNLRAYETSGRLTRPLTTLHSTGDEIVPYWHESLYGAKVRTSGQGSLIQIPSIAYGHCNFGPLEILAAVELLVR